MKLIVTGAAGFIGSHLTERLLKEGHQVIGVDNLSNGTVRNIEHLRDSSSFEFYQLDINDIQKLELKDKVDAFFHLAALADIVPSIEDPYKYHHANVSGTISVLEFCRANGIKRFMYAASSSCYGIPDKYPTSESSKISPEYPYALTKYLGEEYCLNFGKYYDMKVTSLRFFNVYGPRSRTNGTYGAVFGVFLAQKINNKPYTIVGDGNQTRDFTFVTDVVDALYQASINDNAIGQVYNVGSGNTYSINRMVELLGGEYTYIPKRPGEPDCTFADITKIKNELHWEPKVSFESGVKEMLANIDYWKDAPVWDKDSIAQATSSWFKYLK